MKPTSLSCPVLCGEIKRFRVNHWENSGLHTSGRVSPGPLRALPRSLALRISEDRVYVSRTSSLSAPFMMGWVTVHRAGGPGSTLWEAWYQATLRG